MYLQGICAACSMHADIAKCPAGAGYTVYRTFDPLVTPLKFSCIYRQCFEVQCLQNNGQFAVRLHATNLHLPSVWVQSIHVPCIAAAGQALTLSCMRVQGRCNSDPNARSVTIMITDSCPECEADHLDLQVS